MTGPFTDTRNLCLLARSEVEAGEDYLERWWTQTYRAPLDNAPFEERSPAEYHLRMLRDLWHRRRELVQELTTMQKVGAKGKQARLMREAVTRELDGINEVFGTPLQYADPVVAKWDAILAQGGVPDFSKR